ncbi:7,8-didemethyl-8-hydroxy-5-deazariboflavin synthase subunit CofG [Haloferax marisrubri]|uniref:7,8-didemethyl-8-hydroxy-5-deazariboflavin synthase n=1 Tax=Haloferax marisrubri TaxID=1544719 RepID=A0A2P4NR53_9EURY|nr:7,8-didemethyl-8-hydroxy-5-deazariboflavin synthase subunit CofG [Haloferax marisrubri]POG55622.1 7,8-didemethyl-8-hydroxy-5-deazariboflavin synthase subunit CofG [Haloferax marisrubri]
MFPGADEYGVDLTIDDADVERLLAVTPDDADAPASLSFSRNVFIPLTTACRYTCTYCTYYDVPGEATLMSLDEVRETVRTGADAGCTEALFTFGDAPDERYTEIHRQLDEWGYDDILDYLAAACEVALDEGLLPHSNPGDLTREEFADLAPLNASMGVMLETTADVAAHSGSRRKTPGQRLNTIRAAGEVGVPFTTGILVGIGETWRDRAESLLAIRALHERYGHVQEVIVQNVVPNERSDYERPSLDAMRRVVSMARVALPEEVSVQVPPNLSAAADLVPCGVDDLGGVSPVTDDYVNPDYEWPALRELVDIADEAGVPLRERLPVYERFLPDGVRDPAGETGERDDARAVAPDREWLRDPITDRFGADDVHGRRLRNVARGDGPLSIPN